MNREYELVPHPRLKHICCFIVDIDYRTPHLHRELELSLILSGTMRVRTGRETETIPAGGLVLFNASQVHEYKAEGAFARMLCIQVSPQFCRDAFPALQNMRFSDFRLWQHLNPDEYALCRAMAVEFAYRYCAGTDGYELACEALLSLILRLLVLRLPCRLLPDEELRRSRARVERLNRILDYIDTNYMNKVLLADIAKSENVSVCYLSHFFTENLNQSFQSYLFQVRFGRARELAAYTDKRLIDICIECGFSDYRYLYRAFKEQLGCTPNEYRSSRQGGEAARPGALQSVERFLPEEEALAQLSAYRRTRAEDFGRLWALLE